jgi:NADPH:quinone reductase-like Zn-dependent oxidoreductase
MRLAVLATCRSAEGASLPGRVRICIPTALLTAEAVIDASEWAPALRTRTGGADGVLDLVAVRTLLDALRIARYGGRIAMPGSSAAASRSRRSIR